MEVKLYCRNNYCNINVDFCLSTVQNLAGMLEIKIIIHI